MARTMHQRYIRRAMHSDDFFVESEGFDSMPDRRLSVELLERLRRGPLPRHEDLEAAIALGRLVHDELETQGTEGGERLGKDGWRRRSDRSAQR